ncbi:MAG: WbqC family protein, partial [Bacteroidota bacterium]
AASQNASIELEVCQHFKKQQYTNRMWIKGANGDMKLSIPVERRGARMPIRDKKISYAEKWQQQHWKSWVSAYRNSPYFEYYEDSFRPLFEKRYSFLQDLLLDSIELCTQQLKVEMRVEVNKVYRPAAALSGAQDWRRDFDPSRKQWPSWYTSHPYPQVFEGFSPDLSIIDLLFNEGQASAQVLRQSYQDGKTP